MTLPSCHQVQDDHIIFVVYGRFVKVFLRHILAVDTHDDVPEGEQALIQQTANSHAGLPGVIFGVNFYHNFGSITSNNMGRSIPISFNLSGVGIPFMVQPRRR